MRWTILLAALVCEAAETKLGKPLELKNTTAIRQLVDKPADYVGKPVQVKGTVTDVCQMAGCWTQLADEAGNAIRIKVTDGEIEFPKSSMGKTVLAEGTLRKFELTKEQTIARAKHEAEEQGRKFNAASIKSGSTFYQIQGTGAVILD